MYPQLARAQRNKRLTLSTSATPFGCCDYFDSCADEILSLHYKGSLGLLDWLNFQMTDVCYRSVEFITYRRPEQSQGADTAGYLSDPCSDPNGWEFGTRKITVEDFGRIGRAGPVRNIAKPQRYCKTRPVRRLDGMPVTNEFEWDLVFTADQVVDDVRKLVITGNAAVGGQFDGLQQWVSTTHGAPLNSYVVDWNLNTMDGGAGITINGDAIAATFNFIDVFKALFRRIRQRISWNPIFSRTPPALGDMILVLPNFAINCLLDHYTCWSVCEGSAYNEANLQTYEARAFRDNLVSAENPKNLFGYGYIDIDGMTIPLLAHDWELIQGPTHFDMYFLTGQIGGMRIWEGEMLNGDESLAQFNETLDNQSPGDFFTLDGGRMLGKIDTDNLCRTVKLWHFPRLFCMAPWAQIRFQDVRCNDVLDPLSPDPAETSFYPETSFDAATC